MQTTLQVVCSLAGVTIQGAVQRSGETPVGCEVSLPAASSGTLSTRTSDTAGVVTLGAGHGITVTDYIDIFWYESGVLKAAVRGDVTDVTGNDVTFSGCTGDVLPSQSSSITCDARVDVLGSVEFLGDELSIICLSMDRDGHYDFRDASASLKQDKLLANEPWSWYSGQATNPLTGNPVEALEMSNANSSNAATIKLGALLDTV